MSQEIYEVYYGINASAKKVSFEECTLVLGTLGDNGLAFPVERERFPEILAKGDRFFWSENGQLTMVLDDFDWSPTQNVPPEGEQFGEQPNGIPSPFEDNGDLKQDFLDMFDVPKPNDPDIDF